MVFYGFRMSMLIDFLCFRVSMLNGFSCFLLEHAKE